MIRPERCPSTPPCGQLSGPGCAPGRTAPAARTCTGRTGDGAGVRRCLPASIDGCHRGFVGIPAPPNRCGRHSNTSPTTVTPSRLRRNSFQPLTKWMHFYNNQRRHSTIGMLSPSPMNIHETRPHKPHNPCPLFGANLIHVDLPNCVLARGAHGSSLVSPSR